MPQWALPDTDLSAGGWTDQADATADLSAAIDDQTQPVDDTDYVKSGATPVDDKYLFSLSSIYVPATGTVTLHVRCALTPTAPATGTPTAYFTWDAVTGATSYVLQVGSATTLSDIYNASVGNKLSHGLELAPGTYYWRTKAYNGANLISTTSELAVGV